MGVDGVLPGAAHTLLTGKDATFASSLAAKIRSSGKVVPQELAGFLLHSSSERAASGSWQQEQQGRRFAPQKPPSAPSQMVASADEQQWAASEEARKWAAEVGGASVGMLRAPGAEGGPRKKRSRWDT